MEMALTVRTSLYFHEIFSCPFVHFVVQKEFSRYQGSLTYYIRRIFQRFEKRRKQRKISIDGLL